MEDKRYTYCIQPRRVIKDLPDVGNIRTPKILQLTKEEVLICMKSGHVFRRFAAESRNERVTSDNLDRLHNDKFMTEKEYKEFLKNSDVVEEEKEEVAADPVVDNASEEETVETIEFEDSAEVKDEAVAIEETTEEALSEDENTTSDEEEISEDVNDEEIVDEDTEDASEDDEIVDNEEEEAEEVVENHTENNASTLNIQVNNNNYGKKKKKRH